MFKRFIAWICGLFSKPQLPDQVVDHGDGFKPTGAWPNKDWERYAWNKCAALGRTADDEQWFKDGLTRRNWTILLAGMCRYESNFKPSLEYKEKFKDQQGHNVISTGLFQVSRESSRGYGFRVTQKELKDPYMNIDIAVAILKKWIERDGVLANNKSPWRGGARYWSVLRYKKDAIKGYIKRFS